MHSDRVTGRTRSQRSTKSKKFNKCSLQVRDLPLELFRLPRDGRKWRQLARSRRGLLLEISMSANGDGTFLSPDAKINYSPSSKKLLIHRAKETLYRLADDLKELGLLFWHRDNHYGRRFYWIQLPGNQVRYSSENQVRYSPDQVRSADLLSGSTSNNYPSLESPSGVGVPSDDGSPPPLVAYVGERARFSTYTPDSARASNLEPNRVSHLKDDAPTKTEPKPVPSPDVDSDARISEAAEGIVDLLQFENNYLAYEPALAKAMRYLRRTGAFQKPTTCTNFEKRLDRLRVKKIAADKKQVECDRRRERKWEKRAAAKQAAKLRAPEGDPARSTQKFVN